MSIDASRELNLLIIDDDEIDVLDLKRALQRSNVRFTLSVAKDGVDALELLRGENGPRIERPYLIVLDLKMPRMSGIEFLQNLRADAALRDSIVFVWTTSNNERDKTAAYQHNVAGYLLKSDVEQELQQVVRLIEDYVASVQFPI